MNPSIMRYIPVERRRWASVSPAFLWLLMLAVGLWVSAASAANTSPQGVSLALPTTEYWSGAIQTSGAGARLFAAGAVGVSPRQSAVSGAALALNPLALAEAEEETVAVPTLTGLTQADATALLGNAGLSVGEITEAYHATIAAGRVISQDPAAGKPVAPGSAVQLTLSKGPQPVLVPNVVNQTQTTATAALTGAGLRVGAITQAYHGTIPSGSVIAQDPVAGKEVAPGSAVQLTVSKGPAPVTYITVPNVVNQTQTAATLAITGLGLAVGTVTQAYHATIPSGSVIEQHPTAGEQVAPGSAVQLTLSKGPQPVIVPNLFNQTQTAAVAAITGAGLVIGTITQAYHATIPGGSVISQSPAAGTLVAPGSAVALTISKGPDASEGEPQVEGEPEGEGEPQIEGEPEGEPPVEGEPVTPPTVEEAQTLLAGNFAAVDTNGDDLISYAEAVSALPALTQAVFNQLDANGDGSLDKTELGLNEPSGCTCNKGYITPDALKRRLGDLFLMGLSLAALMVVARPRR